MTITMDIEQVTAFAAVVRRELIDLGPDTLDELTDGLEADLAEKLADGEPLGDAAAYAAELRAAAGVAPASRTTVAGAARAAIADARLRMDPLFSQPIVAGVLGFFVALRPVWWLIRAWALFYILAGFTALPQNPFDPWVLMGLVLMSVQWGRGKWLPWAWTRGAVIALSLVALLAVPLLYSAVEGRMTFADHMNPDDYISDGVLLNKQQVTNIFAYGDDGQPLTDVRLVDQNGNPLAIQGDGQLSNYYWSGNDSSGVLVPSDKAAGSLGWNVYPLDVVSFSDLDENNNTVSTDAERNPVTPPFATLPPLLGD